jgi:splicing factor 3A subunit 1
MADFTPFMDPVLIGLIIGRRIPTEEAMAVDSSFKAQPPDGLVVPDPSLSNFIQNIAGYVVRNGLPFETNIKTTRGEDPRLSFLFEGDEHYGYYKWCLEEGFKAKVSGGSVLANGSAVGQRTGPEPPAEFQFSARMPPISAQDLEVIKLTAQFAAKNGRSFITSLSQKEMNNPQFDFLRPQHSYYQYFTRLMDQYTSLLTAGTENGGKLQIDRIAQLEEDVKNKMSIVHRARKRAEWIKQQHKEQQKRDEQEQKEKAEYSSIDWHDFEVVETITFSEADEKGPMPPPTSIATLQHASLEQRAAMSIAPTSRRIEEGIPGIDVPIPTPAAPAQSYQPVSMPAPPQPYMPQPAAAPAPPIFTPSPPAFVPHGPPQTVSAVDQTSQQEAAPGAAPARVQGGTIRARGRRQGQTTNTVTCPNCKEQIPYDQLEQHMKVELLDPRWREQKAKAESRFSTTNLSTVDVANNLKRLASHRDDVFDNVTGEVLSEEEQARRKRAALGQYSAPDTDSSQPRPKLPMGQTMDINEQIKNIQQKYGQPGQQ